MLSALIKLRRCVSIGAEQVALRSSCSSALLPTFLAQCLFNQLLLLTRQQVHHG